MIGDLIGRSIPGTTTSSATGIPTSWIFGKLGPTWVLNPGALHRARHLSFAVVDLETMDCRHVIVEH